MTLGERIKEARKKQGLTQIQLAETSGISVNSIRLYEANKRIPKVDTLDQLAMALNIDVYNLADWEFSAEILQHHTEVKQAIYGEKAEIMDRIAYHLDSLNDEGQQKAVERVEELTEIQKYKKDPQA